MARPGFVWRNYKTIMRVWRKLRFDRWMFTVLFSCVFLPAFLALPVYKTIPLLIVLNLMGWTYRYHCILISLAYIFVYTRTVHIHPINEQYNTKSFEHLFEIKTLDQNVLDTYFEKEVVVLKQFINDKIIEQQHRILNTKLLLDQPHDSIKRNEFSNWFDVELTRNTATAFRRAASQLLRRTDIRLLSDVYTVRNVYSRDYFRFFRDDVVPRITLSDNATVAIWCPTIHVPEQNIKFHIKGVKLKNCFRSENQQACFDKMKSFEVNPQLEPGDCVAYSRDTVLSLVPSDFTDKLESFTIYFAVDESKYRGYRAKSSNFFAKYGWCKNNYQYGSPITEPCYPLLRGDTSAHLLQAVETMTLQFPHLELRLSSLLWYLDHVDGFEYSMCLFINIGSFVSLVYLFYTRLAISFVKIVSDEKKRS